MTNAVRFFCFASMLILGFATQINAAAQASDTPEVQALLPKAEAGDVQAQVELGERYRVSGYQYPGDASLAFYWYSRAAEQGHPVGQFYTGHYYVTGEVYLPDVEKGVGLITQAAEQNYDTAQIRLARMYLYGPEVPQDSHKAIAWFKRLAERTDADLTLRQEAACGIGDTYFQGKGIPADMKAAMPWYAYAAELGSLRGKSFVEAYERYSKPPVPSSPPVPTSVPNITAPGTAPMLDESAIPTIVLDEGEAHADRPEFLRAHKIATALYNEGNYITPFREYIDNEMALNNEKTYESKRRLEWIVARANSGNAQAQWIVGEICRTGDSLFDVPENDAVANQWLRAAAMQGHAEAQATLGEMELLGEGCVVDLVSAFDRLTQAAKADLDRAKRNLGLMYEYGVGVPQDVAKALEWYDQATLNDPYASAILGLALADGRGIEQDIDMATIELHSPALAGYVPAQLRLAEIREQGLEWESDPDYEDAYKWYAFAAQIGTPEEKQRAVAGRERVRVHLTAEQIAAAQAEADKWVGYLD